jgi:hypothetical protein
MMANEEQSRSKQIDIDSMFTYHAPHGDQAQRYTALREKAHELALMIQSMCPDSREKSLAITNLQSTIMWANASIAIHEKPTE